ncbi:MAG: S8 family serine peptidase [Nitrospirae bacterium]|nr:S8 family serine peptidase [Nitrospirota bacterium]
MKLRKHNIFPFSANIIILLVLFSLIRVNTIEAEIIKDGSQKLLGAASEELWVPITSLEIINEGILHLQYLDQYFPTASGHGDREKPEVAAPGEEITTSYPYGFYTNSGTSFSAPHVAGGAALIMQRDLTLFYWPEAIKAILMASAVHNIEGASLLSEFDGAGGISLDLADHITLRGPYGWRISNVPPQPGYFFDSNGNHNFNFEATAGQVVRAVIVWAATPTYAYYNNQPGVDLDMYVYRPSGAEVARSVSWDNTYEIVEFTAPETGLYRLRVYKRRFNDSYTFIGVAWSGCTSVCW